MLDTITPVYRYRYHTGSTGPTLPGWYLLPDGAHYLRQSYERGSAAPAEVWALKRAVELRAFSIPVGAAYFLQNHVTGGRGWGFCNSSFPAVNPALAPRAAAAVEPGPYTLSDFGTTTSAGDQTVLDTPHTPKL